MAISKYGKNIQENINFFYEAEEYILTHRFFLFLHTIYTLQVQLLQSSAYNLWNQQSINSVVTDGQFSNVVLRHLLDEKNKGVFKSPNPLSVTFKDAGKFDVQNPVVGNKASTLTDAQVKKIFSDGEDAKIRASLDVLRNDNTGGNDDEDGPGGGGGNSNGGFTRPKCKKRWRQREPISPLWPLPLPPIALAADLKPPIPLPAPKLSK